MKAPRIGWAKLVLLCFPKPDAQERQAIIHLPRHVALAGSCSEADRPCVLHFPTEGRDGSTHSKSLVSQWTVEAATVGVGWGWAEDPELSQKALRMYFSSSLNHSLAPMSDGQPGSPNQFQRSPPPCASRLGSNMAEVQEQMPARRWRAGPGPMTLLDGLTGHFLTASWSLVTHKLNNPIPSSDCFLSSFYHTCTNHRINILL